MKKDKEFFEEGYDDSDPYEDSIFRFVSDNNEICRKKKFILRLISELHSAGNLSFRTEEYVKHVARMFNVYASCNVFPVNATVTIHDITGSNPMSSQSYTIPISSGLNCAKLALLDQLCYDIRKSYIDFNSADNKLSEIEDICAM